MEEKPLEFDHEYRISETFSKSFDILTKRFRLLLPLFVAAGIANALFETLITEATPTFNIPSSIQNLPPQQMISVAGQVFTLLGYTWVAYVISWIILFFSAGIGIWMLEKKLVTSEAEKKINYASLLGTTIVSVFIVALGLFLLGIGALFFGTILYLCLAASVLEGTSVFGSLGRSRQLVSGRWIKTFVTMGGSVAFAYLVSNFIGGLLSLFVASSYWSSITFLLVQNFLLALSFSLVSASMFVLYHDRKASQQESTVKTFVSPYDSMKPQPLTSSAQRFCMACGAPLGVDSKFCGKCGAPQIP
jgi:hypothetical protein